MNNSQRERNNETDQRIWKSFTDKTFDEARDDLVANDVAEELGISHDRVMHTVNRARWDNDRKVWTF